MVRSVTATLTCVGVFSVAIGYGIARAQSAPADEHHFVPQAAMANMAEIQFGHLAVKKAKDPRVKQFAQMMIDDHVKVQKDLADAASGFGIQWPKQLDASHRQIHQRLSSLSNEQFDREYMRVMVDGHREVEKTLAAHGGEGSGVLAAQVSEWAARTLPAVRAHLKEAEQVSAAIK
jgi:putative membrane protein